MLEFIREYYQVISVTFGLLAALFVIVRVFILGLKSLIRYIEHEQRNKWQAEFFDRNHLEIEEMKKDLCLIKQKYAANNGKLIND